MTPKSRSLTTRIVLFSGIWIIMALVGTGAVLLSFYRSHIASHYDAHVVMHMEEMVSAARLSESGELELAYPPSDPRYHVMNSGWYWGRQSFLKRPGRIVLEFLPAMERGLKRREFLEALERRIEEACAALPKGPADKPRA